MARGDAAAESERTEPAVSERDSQRIIREWDREIDAEIRRAAERAAARGPWRYVSWAALWALWLLVLAALVAHTRPLG